jgi:hypothetical protein
MAKKKAEHAPPVHVLVVDTNILWLEDKGPAVNPEFDKFWQEQKALLPLELVIPEVVRDELVVQHCSSGQKLMTHVNDNLAKLSNITRKKHQHRLSDDGIQKYVKGKFEQWINKADAKVVEVPLNNIDWKALYEKAMWRTAPFIPLAQDTKGRLVEKGFRDALIMETVLSIVKNETRDVNIVFISNDAVLRDCIEAELMFESKFHAFASIADCGSYLKLTREDYAKAFNEKIVKRAAERFYTADDAQCLWIKERIGGRLNSMDSAWKIDDASFTEPTQVGRKDVGDAAVSEQTLFEAGPPARWTSVGGLKLYIGSHEFKEKKDKRTYLWESQVSAIRKFVLVSNENKILEERLSLVEFKVLWKADVKADARFYDLGLGDIKVAKKNFACQLRKRYRDTVLIEWARRPKAADRSRSRCVLAARDFRRKLGFRSKREGGFFDPSTPQLLRFYYTWAVFW